jgi:hypothetical protein
MENNDPDDYQRRCPVLGGPVTLVYCEKCGECQTPCHKIFDCWWETFDVVGYLQKKLSPEDYQKLIEYRPRSKVCSLLDYIEQARSRQ